MVYRAWFVLVVYCAVGSWGQGERGLPHTSPCPDVYSYGWEPAGGWHGIVTILPPARFSEAHLVFRMTVPYYRPEAGVGRVEIKGGNVEIQAISRRAYRGERHKIQFMIIFPPFDQIPRVKEVVINGKTFCADTRVYPDTRSTIELKYTLRTGLTLPVASGNDFAVADNTPTGVSNNQHPSRPGMGQEQVIYVVQGDKGTYVIPGSLVHNNNSMATMPPFNHPSVSSEPTKPPSTTTTLGTTAGPTPSSSSSNPEDIVDYWDIFSSPAPSSGTSAPQHPTVAHPDPVEMTPTTRRPRPRPPKPKPTTTTEAPEYLDSSEAPPTAISDRFHVNGLHCGLQAARPNLLVVNGITAEKGQWPWQVAMFKTSSTGLTFQCGGTLISNRHVITAAHCVYVRQKQQPVTPDTVLIYLGKHNLRSWTEDGQQAKDVERIVLHPNYGRIKNNHDYDVAVLLLSTAAEFSDFVKPACLWDKSPNLNSITNKPGTVVGWGRDENGEIANELKMAKMPVVSQETCLRSDTFYSIFTSNVTYCAGYRNGTSVCNGDSGGGMYFYLDNAKQNTKTWYIRGVVSISRLQPSEHICDDKSYVVFTDLAKMLPWIRQQVRPPAS